MNFLGLLHLERLVYKNGLPPVVVGGGGVPDGGGVPEMSTLYFIINEISAGYNNLKHVTTC